MSHENLTKKNDNILIKKKLVSVIIPTFNSSSFIQATLESVINQTYRNLEILITDDASTDNTLQILENYQKLDKRIKVFKINKNSGAGIARNHSIKFSTGEFIAFCDSDDQWKVDKIEKQLIFMDKFNLSFTYSSYDVIDELGFFKSVVQAPKTISYKKMLNNNYVGCLTAIYDRKLLGKLYMNEIRKRQDWSLWLVIMKKLKKTHGLTESLAIYRDRSNSISSNKFKMLTYNYKIYNKILNYNHFISAFLLINFIFHYVIKKNK